jgi:5,5'-dehydrodivanillate O-demethylase
MMTREENDILTQVGKGTPCGEWLRCFWFPIAVSDAWKGYGGRLELHEPMNFRGQTGTPTSFGEQYGTFKGKPMRVRILGEDLVLYRDLSGTLGLIDIDCPHRRTSMEYGRPRTHGLACQYHGLTLDENGRCLAMPAEPDDSAFKRDIKVTAYPVREMNGLIWAYLGKAEPPALPRVDIFAGTTGLRIVENFGMWPSNWLQSAENSADPVHTATLHGDGSERADLWSQIPKVDWVPHKDGIQTVQYRGNLRRTNFFRLPATATINQPWPGGKFNWPRYVGIWRTPVDDENTLIFHVTYVPELGGKLPELPENMEYPVAASVQKLWLQDYLAIITQGKPNDRTKEYLGTTDRGVVLYRKMIMKGIEDVRAGRDPDGIVRTTDPNFLIDSTEVITDPYMTLKAAQAAE